MTSLQEDFRQLPDLGFAKIQPFEARQLKHALGKREHVRLRDAKAAQTGQAAHVKGIGRGQHTPQLQALQPGHVFQPGHVRQAERQARKYPQVGELRQAVEQGRQATQRRTGGEGQCVDLAERAQTTIDVRTGQASTRHGELTDMGKIGRQRHQRFIEQQVKPRHRCGIGHDQRRIAPRRLDRLRHLGFAAQSQTRLTLRVVGSHPMIERCFQVLPFLQSAVQPLTDLLTTLALSPSLKQKVQRIGIRQLRIHRLHPRDQFTVHAFRTAARRVAQQFFGNALRWPEPGARR
ncbi:hypothetical protein D3C73_724360 [compost metagenome]